MRGDVIPQFFIDGIHDITSDLGRKDAKVIGQDNEHDSEQESPAILPEILIYSLKVLQSKNLGKVTTPEGKNLAVQPETLILRPERWQSGLLRQS